MEVKQKALSGVRWTTTATVVGVIIQTLQLAVVARVLKPEEMGLMAIVYLAIGFSQAFLDMGVSAAIIQRQKISHEELSTLYWLTVMSCLSVFLITCIIAPFMAAFYKEPQLLNLIILVAGGFLIMPWSQQYRVLMKKEMMFSRIGQIDMLSQFVGTVVVFVSLYMGARVYALVFGGLVSTFISTIMYFRIGIRMHKPSFYFRINGVKGFLRFGSFQMMASTLSFFNMRIDSLLIGRLLGMQPLGLFTLPKNLVLRPLTIINPIVANVSFPLMSKIQHDHELLKRTYLKTLNYPTSVTFPICIFLALFPDVAVSILFGAKWYAAIPLLRILALWALFQATVNATGMLALSKGRAGLSFTWNLMLFIFVPVSVYWGSRWGVEGVCYTRLILQIVLFIPSWFFMVNKLISATLWEYLQQFILPLCISLAAGLICVPFVLLVSNVLMKLAIIILLGGATYVMLNIQFNRGFSGVIVDLISPRISVGWLKNWLNKPEADNT